MQGRNLGRLYKISAKPAAWISLRSPAHLDQRPYFRLIFNPLRDNFYQMAQGAEATDEGGNDDPASSQPAISCSECQPSICFLYQMVERSHEQNCVKSSRCHFTKISCISHKQSHLSLEPFLDQILSASFNQCRRKVYSSNRITTPSQFQGDRKSTRLNSSHGYISYAVFCLKKKKKKENRNRQKNKHKTRNITFKR